MHVSILQRVCVCRYVCAHMCMCIHTLFLCSTLALSQEKEVSSFMPEREAKQKFNSPNFKPSLQQQMANCNQGRLLPVLSFRSLFQWGLAGLGEPRCPWGGIWAVRWGQVVREQQADAIKRKKRKKGKKWEQRKRCFLRGGEENENLEGGMCKKEEVRKWECSNGKRKKSLKCCVRVFPKASYQVCVGSCTAAVLCGTRLLLSAGQALSHGVTEWVMGSYPSLMAAAFQCCVH